MGVATTRPAPVNRGGPWLSIRRWIRSAVGCLAWRMVLLLVASLIVLLGAIGWFALELHRQHLLSLLEENAVGIGQTILASAHSSMLANDRVHLASIIENIGQRENVIAVRLVDARGEVRYSNRVEEVGLTSDLENPPCRGCHVGKEVRKPETVRDGLQLYSMPPGRQALGLGVPILNAPECSNGACHVHPSHQSVLGVLDLELSTLPMNKALDDARRQMLFLGIVAIALISATLGIVAWKVVHRPIAALVMGTRQLGGGDLSYRIPEIPSGELGELAASFNDMSTRLQRTQWQLEEWNQLLEVKVAEKTTELEQTRDQMIFAEKMASLGKLAAIVAHEINNPLAGILVYAKLVRRNLARLRSEAGDERSQGTLMDVDEKLATVETEITRCGDIVGNLLRFSRDREFTRAPSGINPIIERSLKLIQHQADLSGVSTHLHLDQGVPDVICDAAQIQQAVVATVMNALEAMSDGGNLTLRSRFDEAAAEVVISVEDTGIGIPEEIRGRIFEPFFSTKVEGKGTGLGLSVTYGIIQRHGGRINIKSRPGEGSVFELVLPVGEPD